MSPGSNTGHPSRLTSHYQEHESYTGLASAGKASFLGHVHCEGTIANQPERTDHLELPLKLDAQPRPIPFFFFSSCNLFRPGTLKILLVPEGRLHCTSRL